MGCGSRGLEKDLADRYNGHGLAFTLSKDEIEVQLAADYLGIQAKQVVGYRCFSVKIGLFGCVFFGKRAAILFAVKMGFWFALYLCK